MRGLVITKADRSSGWIAEVMIQLTRPVYFIPSNFFLSSLIYVVEYLRHDRICKFFINWCLSMNFNSTNPSLFAWNFAEVTIKQLKERVRQAEDSLDQTVKVRFIFLDSSSIDFYRNRKKQKLIAFLPLVISLWLIGVSGKKPVLSQFFCYNCYPSL